MHNNSVLTAGYDGLRVFEVVVETVLKRGIFQFDIVGLASKTVSESKQRILSAIQSCDIQSSRYLNKKIVTLLSPADDKKEGSHFDLPIAVSYLIANKIIEPEFLQDVFLFGELTLRGSLRRSKNIDLILSKGDLDLIKFAIVPKGQELDLDQFPNIKFLAIQSLQELVEYIQTSKTPEEFLGKFKNDITHESKLIKSQNRTHYAIDLIEGLSFAKRALLVGLSGKHHMVFIGPPGVGKSMLAKSASELDHDACNMEVTATRVKTGSPFREPHHTSNYSLIIGHKKYLGEIALANGGILYLDELIEFDRRVLESLRQPLEDGYIVHPEIGRLRSEFIFIGTLNPCGCGYKNSKDKKCVCSSSQIDRYRRKTQSPLFDRIPIKVHLSEDQAGHKFEDLKGEKMVQTIQRVREIQKRRFEKVCNKKQDNNAIYKKEQENLMKDFISTSLSDEPKRIFEQFITVNKSSKRAAKSVLLLARTIADIEHSSDISDFHILEAISYSA